MKNQMGIHGCHGGVVRDHSLPSFTTIEQSKDLMLQLNGLSQRLDGSHERSIEQSNCIVNSCICLHHRPQVGEVL
jgi:hypothetical protein